MHTFEQPQARCNKRLLALLPEEEMQTLASCIDVVNVEFGQTITMRNEPITHIHFLCDCIG